MYRQNSRIFVGKRAARSGATGAASDSSTQFRDARRRKPRGSVSQQGHSLARAGGVTTGDCRCLAHLRRQPATSRARSFRLHGRGDPPRHCQAHAGIRTDVARWRGVVRGLEKRNPDGVARICQDASDRAVLARHSRRGVCTVASCRAQGWACRRGTRSRLPRLRDSSRRPA